MDLSFMGWLGWLGLLGLGLGLPWRGPITDQQMRIFVLICSGVSLVFFVVFALYSGQMWVLEWSVLLGSVNYMVIGLMFRSFRLNTSVSQLRWGSASAVFFLVIWSLTCFHGTPEMTLVASLLGQLMMGWLFWECYQYARVWPSWSSKGMVVLLVLQLLGNFVRTGAVMAGHAQWALFLHWVLAFLGLMLFFLLLDVLQQRKAQQEQQLVNSMAHELRQPLGAMRLKLEHLIHDAPSMPDREAADLLHQLVSENDRASAIIQGLRRFFDMSQAQRQPMNLSEMLEGMVARMRPDFSSRGMALEADVQPGVRVLADAAQLDMVVYNLLLNAREALLEMEEQVDRSVRVHLRAVGDVAQLRVMDNGPGVSKDNAQRIFEIHFTSKAKGTGLGLWLCRAVVQEHGGQLALLPSDRGAAFEVRLPLLAEASVGLNRSALGALMFTMARKKGAQIE